MPLFKRFINLIDLSNATGESHFAANLARLVLFWNPLIMLLFLIAYDDFEHFGRAFVISYSIANSVAIFCMTGSLIVFRTRALYYRWRQIEAPQVHWGWKFLIANVLVLPGLKLGFTVTEELTRLLGWHWHPPTFDSYRQGVLNGLIISSSFFLYRIWSHAKSQKKVYELQVKTLENETLKARLAALNYQMNPHLLFNSLNTIASMIPGRPEAAEDMTVQLSELYRGILVSMKDPSHSLSKEFDLVRAYLNIEHARFGDRVRFDIDIEENLDANRIQIPVLLVQPLVENAIKHGISAKPEGGNVQIRVRGENSTLKITVEDDGVGFGHSTSRAGSGTGIKNCEMRLQMMFGNRGRFEVLPAQPGTRCEIELPLNAGGAL